jgi:hypothetical protein
MMTPLYLLLINVKKMVKFIHSVDDEKKIRVKRQLVFFLLLEVVSEIPLRSETLQFTGR